MKKVNWEQLREKVKATDGAVLKAVIRKIDGHTIYDPKAFLDEGLDPAIVAAFTKTQKSGNHPKEQIYVGNTVVAALKGVYGLDLLEFIARTFNVESWKLGRGSRAQHLAEQLWPKL